MITAQYQCDQTIVIGIDNQGFQTFLWSYFQAAGECLYAVHSGGVYALHGCPRCCAFTGWRQGFDGFDIGGELPFAGKGDGIFS